MKKRITFSLLAVGLLGMLGVGTAYAHGFFGMPRENMLERKAELFSMTTRELQAELDSGKTFHEIMEEQGISQEDMQATMHQMREEGLGQGRIKMLEDKAELFGMTQEELAGKLHTKKSAISRIENHAEDIKLSTLEKFTRALGRHLRVEIA